MQALNKEFINLNKKTLHLSLDDSRITSHEIFQNLGSLDVLLIEKIDRLPQDQDWELQIFALINDALSGNTKIYLSSNLVSKDLKIGLKDLKSRLSYFTAIEIPEITDEEKIEALPNFFITLSTSGGFILISPHLLSYLYQQQTYHVVFFYIVEILAHSYL